jgi:hypothetical protein
MKTYWGSGGIGPRILDLGTRKRWVVSFTLRPLYPRGKSPWYPFDRRLGGPQSQSGLGFEEKNSQLLPVPKRPIIQLVAQRSATELSRLPIKHIYQRELCMYVCMYVRTYVRMYICTYESRLKISWTGGSAPLLRRGRRWLMPSCSGGDNVVVAWSSSL